jgi:hypothetical protein
MESILDNEEFMLIIPQEDSVKVVSLCTPKGALALIRGMKMSCDALLRELKKENEGE